MTPIDLESELPKSLSAFLTQAASRQPWEQLIMPLDSLHSVCGSALPIAKGGHDWEG
jgi:hypothetical protein